MEEGEQVTFRFTWQNRKLVLDLTAEEADDFNSAIKQYVDAAKPDRKRGTGSTASSSSSSSGPSSPSIDVPDNVRQQWDNWKKGSTKWKSRRGRPTEAMKVDFEKDMGIKF